jgi:cupin fold WbuC family metalloprotein
MLIHISSPEISILKEEATLSSRKRKNFNFHKEPGDTMQRMMHAMNPGTYVQPHKHENPDKREAFIILEGRVAVIEFDDDGNILSHFILDRNIGNYGAEVPERTWHMLIALRQNSVIYEVKDGPYSPGDDKYFASWAPVEGSETCEGYLKKIIRRLKLSDKFE